MLNLDIHGPSGSSIIPNLIMQLHNAMIFITTWVHTRLWHIIIVFYIYVYALLFQQYKYIARLI